MTVPWPAPHEEPAVTYNLSSKANFSHRRTETRRPAALGAWAPHERVFVSWDVPGELTGPAPRPAGYKKLPGGPLSPTNAIRENHVTVAAS